MSYRFVYKHQVRSVNKPFLWFWSYGKVLCGKIIKTHERGWFVAIIDK